MTETGCGEPVLCEGVHALPGQPVARTASAQRLTPSASDRVAAYREQAAMARHPSYGSAPAAHFSARLPAGGMGQCMRRRSVSLTCLQFLAQPLAIVLRRTVNLPVPRLTAYRRQAEEVEGLRFALAPPLAPFGRQASQTRSAASSQGAVPG